MLKNILIVDDSKNNIEVLMETLSDDYEISVATDGETALEIVNEEKPDLVLLDILMPGMNGYEVCERLKKNPKLKEIPVIFITAMSDEEDETKGFDVGAVDFIAKPIRPPVVKARVKTHLHLEDVKQRLENQNRELIEAAELKEDVEKITRHDLKTPLDTIIGFPELIIEDGNLNEEQIENLNMIEDAGYRMLNMINLSLDLFKMERGLYQFKAKDVNISKIIKKIIKEEQQLCRIKELTCSFLIKDSDNRDEAFFAKGEELLCYSMFANIIKNALEASPEKESVMVSLSEENSKAVIEIHNKGVIPEDIRETFFNKYVSSGKEMGTGLGTYSAKLIADTQKGKIYFESSKEKGTSLFIELDR